MELEEGVEGGGASLLGPDHQEVGQAATALLFRPRIKNSRRQLFFSDLVLQIVGDGSSLQT